MDNEQDTTTDSVRIKINFRVPGRMPTVYAHHLFVQPGENEVLLSFFEVVPPLVNEGEATDALKFLQETGVTAECVARVTVAKNKFKGFSEALQQVADQLASEQNAEKGQENADSSGNNQQD